MSFKVRFLILKQIKKTIKIKTICILFNIYIHLVRCEEFKFLLFWILLKLFYVK